MIPVPVIEHFLTDIKDGRYDRYMDLSIGTFNLLNPAHRKALGVEEDDRGVVVSSVQTAGVAAGIVKTGDVILSIDGLPVASDGSVELGGERVLMAEVAERKFLGDSVQLSIIRDKQPMELTVKFNSPWPHLIQGTSYDTLPRYVLAAGLLFQPLTRNLVASYQFQNPRINYFFDFFISKELYREHPEVIVLSAILPDPINTYLADFREGIVSQINNRKIKTLDDLAAAFAEKPDFYVVEFLGVNRPLVLERAAVEAAQERIQRRYNVPAAQNLEEKPSAS
jgi:hypothetical protein